MIDATIRMPLSTLARMLKLPPGCQIVTAALVDGRVELGVTGFVLEEEDEATQGRAKLIDAGVQLRPGDFSPAPINEE